MSLTRLVVSIPKAAKKRFVRKVKENGQTMTYVLDRFVREYCKTGR